MEPEAVRASLRVFAVKLPRTSSFFTAYANGAEMVYNASMKQQSKSKGLRCIDRRVYIHGRDTDLYSDLSHLVGHFDAEALNRLFEEQLSSSSQRKLEYAEENDPVAKLAASFEDIKIFEGVFYVYLYTGLKLDGEKIILCLEVSKNKRGQQQWQASMSWFLQHADGLRDPIRPIPDITNYGRIKSYLSEILGTTKNLALNQIREQLATSDPDVCGPIRKWPPAVTLIPKDTDEPPITLAVTEYEDDSVSLDETPLLNHPRYPRFYRYFERSILGNRSLFAQLAELAQKEEAPCGWAYIVNPEELSEQKKEKDFNPYHGLVNYIFQIFTRLCDDAEVSGTALIRYNGKLCFCTGLLGRKSGRYIYGVASEPTPDGHFQKLEWVENDYTAGRDPRLPPEGKVNHGLPYPANWTRSPGDLICQYEKLQGLAERIDFDHILDDHPERLPLTFFLTAPDGHTRSINKTYARKAISDAIEEARKRVQANYRYVQPGYYRGQITLQLPLCLEASPAPNAYLVLTRHREDEGHYWAPTLLPPSMAYYNSRVITPQERNAWEDNFFAEIRRNQDVL